MTCPGFPWPYEPWEFHPLHNRTAHCSRPHSRGRGNNPTLQWPSVTPGARSPPWSLSSGWTSAARPGETDHTSGPSSGGQNTENQLQSDMRFFFSTASRLNHRLNTNEVTMDLIVMIYSWYWIERYWIEIDIVESLYIFRRRLKTHLFRLYLD